MIASALTESPNLSRLVSRYAIFGVLAILYVVAILVSEAFLQPGYVLNILRQVAPVGIAAIGVTFVMILGGVDLSIGAVISFTSVICAVWMDGDAANLPVAVAVACLAGVAVGAFNGMVIAFSRVSPFILTLGVGLAVAGLTQMYSGGTARGVVSPGFREFFNHRVGGLVPVLAIAFLGLAAAGHFVSRSTLFGRRLFLIGSSPRAAALSGLPIRGTIVVAYALSGLAGALAGIALLARSGVSNTLSGQGLEFQVLAAVVLGGTTFEGGRGGVAGTIGGVLVLVVSFNLVNISGLPYHMQLIVMGAIIILASAAYRRLGA